MSSLPKSKMRVAIALVLVVIVIMVGYGSGIIIFRWPWSGTCAIQITETIGWPNAQPPNSVTQVTSGESVNVLTVVQNMGRGTCPYFSGTFLSDPFPTGMTCPATCQSSLTVTVQNTGPPCPPSSFPCYPTTESGDWIASWNPNGQQGVDFSFARTSDVMPSNYIVWLMFPAQITATSGSLQNCAVINSQVTQLSTQQQPCATVAVS
ncbi:MAG: hypothetical protein ACLP9D_16095 [Candidatus Bathyarchaeia archaeon]